LSSGFVGKKVTVIGAGESGFGACLLLHARGAKVRCSFEDLRDLSFREFLDAHAIPFEEQKHTSRFLQDADWVVLSPGVKPSAFPVRYCQKQQIPMTSELGMAASFLKGRWAAVTGTSGKTTTTELAGAMMGFLRPTVTCGNIGRSLSRSVFEDGARTARIVEASSFQLCFTHAFRPAVAVILNLGPNHLDWHPSLGHYYGSKCRIGHGLGKAGVLAINADDPLLCRRMRRLGCRKWYFSRRPLEKGLFAEGRYLWLACRGRKQPLATLDQCALKYPHQVENVLAAASAALLLGARRGDIQKALDRFRPLPHRLEDLGEIGGVRFVNDSKSTTAQSTRAALRSFPQGVVLVAGGRLKEKRYASLLPDLRRHAAHVVLYGEGAPILWEAFGSFTQKSRAGSMSSAVLKAYSKARPGQTLLLSPMGASFDQFRSYADRGEAFREMFRTLRAKA